MSKKTVVIGLSGGVDSSVSAWLLKEQGYNVIGLFMKNWEDDDDSEYCSSRQDFLDAASAAEKIGIDLEAVNFAKEYKERVFSEFLREYQSGRTPNPDVLCNREIKFGPFLEEAKKLGPDYIATGHYCKISHENGIHRLVRISPFDASGRRHTSFAAVEVMPEITEDSEIELRDEDIKMDVYRSSGAGGQKVNKTSSAVRLTHIPTGIVVSSQVERSHFQNLENCKNMLRARLAEIKEREHLEKISDIKGVQLKIEWGSQIRSYVFMPYTLAKDHRTGYENGNIQAVMDGDIDGFINAYLSMNADKENK